MSERYQGGFITATVVNPDGEIADSATATGVWTLPEQFVFNKASLWPKINARGLFMGGNKESPFTYYDIIDSITIASAGNAADFGDLSVGVRRNGSCSSQTRAVSIGGLTVTNGEAVNVMEFVTIATAGNATDFGDITTIRSYATGVSSKTRGVYASGRNPATTNSIEYITLASTGDATDFGDMTSARTGGLGGAQSPVRGLFAGGDDPSDVIEYITIASTGNATDFGDLDEVSGEGVTGTSSNLRAIFKHDAEMEFVTIASTGNVTDFGDPLGGASSSTSRARHMAGLSNNITGIFAGGEGVGNTSGFLNIIEFVTIATTGDTADFGDLTQARNSFAGASQGHGGHQ
tara:strand:+ start:189 stop:1232 length:1044 start_codon:yes stop_codon:yes gene_type:complete